MFLLYSVLITLLSPIIMLGYYRRIRQGKESRALAGERFGTHLKMPPAGPDVYWVHAVSVGETVAAKPIIRELRKARPDAWIVLSTTTLTGRDVASKVSGVDQVIQFPIDFPWCTARALKAIHPCLIILMEAELWPGFIGTAKRMGVPVAVVNGRFSDAKLTSWLRFRWLLSPAINGVDQWLMQSDEDSDRAHRLGAAPGKISIVGNTKFDESSVPLTYDERLALRATYGIPADAPVIILGSTREDRTGGPSEEAQLLPECKALRSRFPNLHIIIAQRHIERVDAILELCPDAARRSKGEMGWLLVLDTFGELATAYAAADIAFIGGSLVPWGGQSVFQPLAQGITCCFGPHMDNQKDIANLALRSGVATEVGSPEAFRQHIEAFLSLPKSEQDALGARARALIDVNLGVSERYISRVLMLVPH
jgi:3-deoxy-D-manno-octulosonic-acid transferase